MTQKKQNKNTSTILDLLDELRIAVDDIAHATIREKGIYGCVLRASVVKSYEFTSLAYQDPPPEHAFFITATLRGICEDLIAFTFLEGLSKNERNEALTLLMELNIAEGIDAQSDFFSQNRPWQPVVQSRTKNQEDAKEKLRLLSTKLGWTGRQAWPTVWYMAKETQLHALYSYLYSTTSKWVHFSPQILLRMGWGGKKDEVGDHTEWTFTTSNFSQYYSEFNQTYSLLLLLRIICGPAEKLIPYKTQKIVAKLEDCLNEPLRWPEAVTYEELNLESPSSFMRILIRASHDTNSDAN